MKPEMASIAAFFNARADADRGPHDDGRHRRLEPEE